MKSIRFNLPLLLLTLFVIGVLLAAGLHITHVDTDITRYLPRKDPILADAADIFKHHPIQGEMVIDLGLAAADPDRLVQAGQDIVVRLESSGLFSRVGTQAMQDLFPDLVRHITDLLPVLFNAEELDDRVLPLLAPDRINQQLWALQADLLGLDSIGQAQFLARDPLGLRNIVLAKLTQLAPASDIEFYKGQLLSADHRHLLIVATPTQPGTDTAYARRLSAFLDDLALEFSGPTDAPDPLVVTPMGAYRAALDNERIARKDVRMAIGLATLCIALLLVLVFPRPLIGVFAFLPAIAGTAAAFFMLALLHKTISIMAIGFGGAIISITVDHGIAYLLFLDQSQTTYGKQVSSEIWAIGFIAALTTIGAFTALNLTGFPILAQMGQFAAWGIAFSFLFVHLVFPKIFPQLPPARPRNLPFFHRRPKLPMAGKPGALAALAFGVVMFFFVDPDFNASLSSMNTVSRETAASEALMTRVWGESLFDKLYIMTEVTEVTEADSVRALQAKGDQILALADQDIRAHRLAPFFLPSMLFPGPARRQANFAAWREFWTTPRTVALGSALGRGAEMGFTPNAFDPFLQTLAAQNPPVMDPTIPEALYPLLGIVRGADGGWRQFATLAPGPEYDAARFQVRYGALAKSFDPNFFSSTLGQLLFTTFLKMLVIIGVSVTLLIFLFFLDLKLTAITLTPVAFAMVSTLGTLSLLGHPLDISALMIAIIVFGMGIDYALFLVRAYQRYGGTGSTDFGRIQKAVVMAAFSSLIGFGVLGLAEHAVLHSAGLTSLLGIGYSLIGAFLLLPPLLTHHFRQPRPKVNALPLGKRQRVLIRYQSLEPYPRLFARFKMKTDVLFSELTGYLDGLNAVQTVLDIGCGYGVPGCWVLEHFPNARIYGIDPHRERIRVASRVFADRGQVQCESAPFIPQVPQPADLAFLLDIVHFLNDEALLLTLQRLHKALGPKAALIIRAIIPPAHQKYSKLWRVEALKMKYTGISTYHRPVRVLKAMLASSGFNVQQTALSGNNPESSWVIAVPKFEEPQH